MAILYFKQRSLFKKDPKLKKQMEVKNQFLEYLPPKKSPFLDLQKMDLEDWNFDKECERKISGEIKNGQEFTSTQNPQNLTRRNSGNRNIGIIQRPPIHAKRQAKGPANGLNKKKKSQNSEQTSSRPLPKTTDDRQEIAAHDLVPFDGILASKMRHEYY